MGPLARDTASGLGYRVLDGMEPEALLLLLHGVGSRETDLADLGRLVGGGFRVVLPRGPLPFGRGGSAWFEVQFGPQGPAIRADQAEDSRRRLSGLVESLQGQWAIPPGRTVIAGFSQGGILSASLALTQPGLVAGFGLLSGRILPELAPLLAPRAELERLSAFVSHGREDATLPVAWAERSTAWLTELGVPHRYRLYPGGHGLNPEVVRDFRTWLEDLVGRTPGTVAR